MFQEAIFAVKGFLHAHRLPSTKLTQLTREERTRLGHISSSAGTTSYKRERGERFCSWTCHTGC